MTDNQGETVAFPHNLKAYEPRLAPLEMPIQVLETVVRPTAFGMFGRLFVRNA